MCRAEKGGLSAVGSHVESCMKAWYRCGSCYLLQSACLHVVDAGVGAKGEERVMRVSSKHENIYSLLPAMGWEKWMPRLQLQLHEVMSL